MSFCVDQHLRTTSHVRAANEDIEETKAVQVATPETKDPEILIRHLESHEPVKLALARDYPLVVQKLEKTAKGIQAMMEEAEGEESLHKGLGWLHYRTYLAIIKARLISRDPVDIRNNPRILHPSLRPAP